jgi:hypothetical protein
VEGLVSDLSLSDRRGIVNAAKGERETPSAPDIRVKEQRVVMPVENQFGTRMRRNASCIEAGAATQKQAPLIMLG